MRALEVQLALGLTSKPPARGSQKAALTERQTGPTTKDALTVHDTAQLWFAFAREADR